MFPRSLKTHRLQQLLTVADDAFLSFSETLGRLILDNCGLTSLDPNVITVLENPDLYVWLGGNPWNCECNLKVSDLFITVEPGLFDTSRGYKNVSDMPGCRINRTRHIRHRVKLYPGLFDITRNYTSTTCHPPSLLIMDTKNTTRKVVIHKFAEKDAN